MVGGSIIFGVVWEHTTSNGVEMELSGLGSEMRATVNLFWAGRIEYVYIYIYNHLVN